jgi:metal-responsive CopG/Arc/MetJ family transcriptional regulator
MPPKGFVAVTLPEELLKELEEFAEAKGFRSAGAAVRFLLLYYKSTTTAGG